MSTHDDDNANTHDGNESIEDPPANGVLVVGTVIGAHKLSHAPEPTEEGVKTFFKVLYAEGSAKYQSKAVIFSSSMCEDLVDPAWKSQTFTHESMLVPSVNPVVGSILIAFYRTRPNGGNDFLGQAVFDLGEISRTGIVEFKGRGIESRSLDGSFPIIDRAGTIAGDCAEVEVHLDIAWRSSDALAAVEAAVNRTGETTTRTHTTTPRSVAGIKSSTVSGMGGGRGNSDTRPASGGASRAGTSRASSGGGLSSRFDSPRTIGSGTARKLKEDQARIEKENKILQSKLIAVGPPSTGGVYSKQAGNVGTAGAAGSNPAGGEAKASARVLTQSDLEALATKLKKEVADMEKENSSLKATVSKVKSHAKKYEMSVNSIKKSSASDTTGSGTADAKVAAASGRVGSSASVLSSSSKAHKATESKDLRVSAISPATASVVAAEPKKQHEGEDREAVGEYDDDEFHADDNVNSGDMPATRVGGGVPDGNTEYVDEDPVSYSDAELNELVDEYRVLQGLRRALVARIKVAQESIRAAMASKDSSGSLLELAKQRLALSVGGSSTGRPAGGAGGVGGEDVALREQMTAMQVDLASAEAAQEHGLHVGELDDAIAEMEAVKAALTNQVDRMREDCERARYERDLYEDRLHALLDDKVVYRLQDDIATMRSTIVRLSKTQRTAQLLSAANAIDVELIRLDLRKQAALDELDLAQP